MNSAMEAIMDTPSELFSAIHSSNALITTVLFALILPLVSRRLYEFFTRDWPNMVHYVLMNFILRREAALVQSDARALMSSTPIMNDELIEIVLLYVNHLLRASSFATHGAGAAQVGKATTAEATSTSSVLFPFPVSAESLRYASYRLVQKPRAQTERHSASSGLGNKGSATLGSGAAKRLAELLQNEYEVSLAPGNDVAVEVEPGLFLKVVPTMRPWRLVRHERRQQRRLMRRIRESQLFAFASATGGLAGGENTLLGGTVRAASDVDPSARDSTEQSRLTAQARGVDRAAKQRSAIMLASDVLDEDVREFLLFHDLLRDMRLRMRDPLQDPRSRAQASSEVSGDDERQPVHMPNLFTRLATAAKNGPYSADYDEGDSEDTDEESEEVDDDSGDNDSEESNLDERERLLTVPEWMPRQLIIQCRAFRSRTEERAFIASHQSWQRERARQRVRDRAEGRGWSTEQLADALDVLDRHLDHLHAQQNRRADSSVANDFSVLPDSAAFAELSAATGLSLAELREAHLLAPQSRVDQFLFRAVLWYHEELQRSTARESHFLMYPYAGELEAALQVRMQKADQDDDDGGDYDDDYYDDGDEPNPLAAPPNSGRLLAVRRYALPEHGGKTFEALFFSQKARVMQLLDDFSARRGKFGVPGVANKLTILLHGPPGTGKTSLVKAMARYLKRHVLVIPLTTLHTNGALQDWMSEREATCVGETSTVCDVDDEDMDDLESYELDYYTSTVAKKVTLRPPELIYLLEDVDAVDWHDVQDDEEDVEERAARRLRQLGFTPLHADEEAADGAPGKGEKGAKGKNSKTQVAFMEEDENSEDGLVGSEDSRGEKRKKGGGADGSDSEDLGDDDDDDDEEDSVAAAEKKRKRMERLFQAVFVQLERDRLSIDGILRVLNGVTVPASRITVLTTNHPEKLDSRLLQPGVISMKINMDDLDKENAREMIEYYFADILREASPAPNVASHHDTKQTGDDDVPAAASSASSSSLRLTNAHKNLRHLLDVYERDRAAASAAAAATTAKNGTSSSTPTSPLSSTTCASALKINPARLEQLCVECDSVEQLVSRLRTTETRYGNVF